MSAPARLPRLLAALSLTIPLLSSAQAPAMTDLERAQRDADKVLSFIKFQTVRAKPAETPDKPRKPATPNPPRPAAAPRHAEAAPAASPVAPTTTAEPITAAPRVAATALPATDPVAPPLAELPAATFGAPAPAPAAAVTLPAAEPAPEPEAAEPEEVPLQIQHFVAPVLPRSVQATLVGGSRRVTVRFTVEPDGSVSKAEAAADVPGRFGRPATEAILQWKFAPLPQARTVDVELAFKRESSG